MWLGGRYKGVAAKVKQACANSYSLSVNWKSLGLQGNVNVAPATDWKVCAFWSCLTKVSAGKEKEGLMPLYRML